MDEQFIGNYKILKKIGAGGMARVYLAVHKDVPNLKVVLKILSDPAQADRFRQEADKLALLDGHPNICRIKHFFNHGDDFVIAMDYIDGVTLEEKITADGKFELGEALRITAEVLDILDVAHQKDIYHRDIKPSNIMIDKKGHIRIIDFGIAKGKSDPSLTMAGTACGTPAYMAPEQFTADEGIDYALADVYATGTSLYCLLTGEVPFKGDNQFLIRDAKLTQDPESPRKINSAIPKDVESVIMKALKRDPANRFQTALEMKNAVLPLMSKYSDQSEPMTEAVPTHHKTATKTRKSRTVPLIIGVASLAVIAIALWLILKPGSEIEYQAGESATPFENQEKPDSAQTEQEGTTNLPVLSSAGTISISIEPSGDVYLNNALVARGISDTVFTRDTGQYVLKVENNRAVQKMYESEFHLAPDENFSRQFTFEFPIPDRNDETPPAVVDSGVLIVGSRPPKADIYIDGDLQDETTPMTFAKPVGRYTVRIVVDDNGQNYEHTEKASVRKNDTTRVVYDALK